MLLTALACAGCGDAPAPGHAAVDALPATPPVVDAPADEGFPEDSFGHVLFAPIRQATPRCSAYGPAWRRRVTDAIGQARERSRKLVPEEAWTSLVIAAPMNSTDPTPEQAADCERFVATLADPAWPQDLRASFVAGQLITATSGCVAGFPDRAAEFRAAWLDAFERNGLRTDAPYFDELVASSWRKNAASEEFRRSCDQMLATLRGEAFDTMVSEAFVRRALVRRWLVDTGS